MPTVRRRLSRMCQVLKPARHPRNCCPPWACGAMRSLLLHCQLPSYMQLHTAILERRGDAHPRRPRRGRSRRRWRQRSCSARRAKKRLQAADGARSDGQQHCVCAAGHARQGLARQQTLAATTCALRASYVRGHMREVPGLQDAGSSSTCRFRSVRAASALFAGHMRHMRIRRGV